MRACQHRQSRQPPPTLTKHSTPKVAGNSPLPISCGKIISLKFRHFQHMIEHSIIELHAKLQGAHRTTVPHSATISARASPQQLATPGHSRGATTTRPNAQSSPGLVAPTGGNEAGARSRVTRPKPNWHSVEAANPAREGQVPPGGGNCESDQAEQPEGGVHRGKVAGLMNKREDQPGDRTGDAS